MTRRRRHGVGRNLTAAPILAMQDADACCPAAPILSFQDGCQERRGAVRRPMRATSLIIAGE